MKKVCLFILLLLLSCKSHIKQYYNDIDGGWDILSLNINNISFLDSLNYKRVSFNSPNKSSLKLPKIDLNNYDYENSSYSFVVVNDTIKIKINSTSNLFNGVHSIKITKDFNKNRKNLTLKSNNFFLKAESIDFESIKQKIEQSIDEQNQSVIFK